MRRTSSTFLTSSSRKPSTSSLPALCSRSCATEAEEEWEAPKRSPNAERSSLFPSTVCSSSLVTLRSMSLCCSSACAARVTIWRSFVWRAASKSSRSTLLPSSAATWSTLALAFNATCSSVRSGFCSRSYTEAFPSRAWVMSVSERFTSEMFAFRSSAAWTSAEDAFASSWRSSDLTASPCALITSCNALKVERITSWMFRHSFIPWRRSSTTTDPASLRRV
mmetsp:Transcript_5113/g.12300  ORF Transcript_5113/g.12300 Transcript_5113/m.12300 type:complete len:222 (-) Transcript_5113:290-955(-)